MHLYNQPEICHYYKKCTCFLPHGNDLYPEFLHPKFIHWLDCKLSVVVIEGVTVGHPCCAVHNCKNPLSNNRHCYCATHITQAEQLQLLHASSWQLMGRKLATVKFLGSVLVIFKFQCSIIHNKTTREGRARKMLIRMKKKTCHPHAESHVPSSWCIDTLKFELENKTQHKKWHSKME